MRRSRQEPRSYEESRAGAVLPETDSFERWSRDQRSFAWWLWRFWIPESLVPIFRRVSRHKVVRDRWHRQELSRFRNCNFDRSSLWIAIQQFSNFQEKQMDRCCRQHDICPVKIRAYQSRYDLTNNSLYTKSHCTCDDLLFACLKATNTSASQLMGNIYFNLVQVPCIVENREGKVIFKGSREGF